MSCSSCVALPILFSLIFLITVIICYILSQTLKLTKHKTPFICEMAMKKPARYIYLIGMILCTLCFIPMVIIQYFRRNVCYDGQYFQDNITTMSMGIVYAILLPFMAWVDIKNATSSYIHWFFAICAAIFGVIYGWNTIQLTIYQSADNGCLQGYNISVQTFTVVSKTTFYWGACAQAGAGLSMILTIFKRLIRKCNNKTQKQTENGAEEQVVLKETMDNNEQEIKDEKLRCREKCWWTFGAIQQYLGVLATLIFVAFLSSTELL